MLKHIIKLSLRNLYRYRLYSFINIGGLAIALGCSFLIYLFVLHETSYDKFHKNADNIYRVNEYYNFGPGELTPMSSTSFQIGPYFKKDFPEVINYARIKSIDSYYGGQFVLKGEEYIKELNYSLVDENFFEIFSFEFTSGNKDELFNDFYDLVITEKIAKKYFGNINVLGNKLVVKNTNGEFEYRITGVIKDIPSFSTIQIDFFGNMEMAKDEFLARGWGGSIECFLLLNEKTDLVNLQNKIDKFPETYHPDQENEYKLQNIKDMHFHSGHLQYYLNLRGNIKNVYFFTLIAILILFIASINYIIISTARSTQRTIEIGIRKVVGAGRKNLLKQIMSESVLFSLIAFPLAIMIAELLLPTMNRLLDKEMIISYFNNWKFVCGMILITLFIGVISGSYLSMYLSRFKPENILRKRFTNINTRGFLRKILISTQLTIFIVLFIFSEIIYKQLRFIEKSNPGFTTSNLLIVKAPHDHNLTSCAGFVNEINNHSDIICVSEVSSGIFTNASIINTLSNPDSPDNNKRIFGLSADYNFINAYGFKILNGRAHSIEIPTDSDAIVLNQTAVKELELYNPVGKYVMSDTIQLKIIGVVEDFNIGSLHEKIPPICISIKSSIRMVCHVAVKTNKAVSKDLLAFLENKWTKSGPPGPFEYTYLDKEFDNLYEKDRNFGNTIKLFTILTIIIASLGLFGFSTLMSKQRTKEIGIRKVFGASVSELVGLINKEFIILVIIANLISVPISIYFSKTWLENFAYQTSIGIIPYLFSAFITLLLVTITLGYNSIKTANCNPADSIRHE